MVEYNTVNVKLSNSQLNKLKSAVKNKQGTTLRMNARIFNGNNLPHELLLTTRQTTKLRNAIENNLQTDIKLSKAQISKIIQSGGFFRQNSWSIIKNWIAIIKISYKTTWIIGSNSCKFNNRCRSFVISSEEMSDIMKIVQALEDSNISLKGVAKTIKNETKEQKGGFLSMLLGTLGASLLGDLLKKTLSGKGTARAEEGYLRAGEGI